MRPVRYKLSLATVLFVGRISARARQTDSRQGRSARLRTVTATLSPGIRIGDMTSTCRGQLQRNHTGTRQLDRHHQEQTRTEWRM